MAFTARCNRRLQREVMDLLNKSATENSSCGICFELPNEEDITKLTAYLQGPQDSPYEKGIFALSVEYPTDYPMSPPKIKFDTRIWHPNISSVTGAVCLNTLSTDWTPSLSTIACILSIRTLLSEPAVDDPQDAMVAAQYKDDIRNYIATAKYWTNEFASKHEKYENLDEFMKMERREEEEKNPEDVKLLESFKSMHERIVGFKISRTRALEALALENWNFENAMGKLGVVFEVRTLPMIRPSASPRRRSVKKVKISTKKFSSKKSCSKKKLEKKITVKKTPTKKKQVKKTASKNKTTKKKTTNKKSK